jgi:general secretion pathway protein C
MGMDVYIKKYFWLIVPLTIIICAALGATAVGHVVEAVALTDSDKPAKHVVVRPPPPVVTGTDKPDDAAKTRPLAMRNMFCSECPTEEPVAATDGPVTDDGSPPITQLPLHLVATSVSTVESSSFATVLNTATNVEGAYWVGHEIPGAGPVVRVYGKFADFENKSAKRVERMSLLAGEVPRPAAEPVAVAPPVDDGAPKDDLLAAVDAGVKKVDETNFEISRALVDKVLANPTAVMKGARVVPSVKNGQPNGFKLYAIRPSSVYAKIGLMNGDTLHAVNGLEITSLEKGLEVFTKVRESSSLSVSITRRGKPVNLGYTIK